MYTIGEISKLVNVSTDTIRYYDEIGLVTPVEVNLENNYRYYSDEEVRLLLTVSELKSCGLTLKEIRCVLEGDGNIMNLFHLRKSKLKDDLENVLRMIRNIELRISRLSNNNDENISTVMIVDDNKLTRLIIRNLIELLGYSIICEADNGKIALENYEIHKPDLVIMGIRMPVLDGIDSAKGMRDINPDTTIVLCSSINEFVAFNKAIEMKLNGYILKPFRSEYLQKILISKPVIDERVKQYFNFLSDNKLVERYRIVTQNFMDYVYRFLYGEVESLDEALELLENNEMLF